MLAAGAPHITWFAGRMLIAAGAAPKLHDIMAPEVISLLICPVVYACGGMAVENREFPGWAPTKAAACAIREIVITCRSSHCINDPEHLRLFGD